MVKKLSENLNTMKNFYVLFINEIMKTKNGNNLLFWWEFEPEFVVYVNEPVRVGRMFGRT